MSKIYLWSTIHIKIQNLSIEIHSLMSFLTDQVLLGQKSCFYAGAPSSSSKKATDREIQNSVHPSQLGSDLVGSLLVHPGTRGTSGNQLTDFSASHWRAVTLTLRGGGKKILSSSHHHSPRGIRAHCLTRRELVKHGHQGNHWCLENTRRYKKYLWGEKNVI